MHSPEAKARIAEGVRRAYAEGRLASNFAGQSFTEQERAAISERMRGNRHAVGKSPSHVIGVCYYCGGPATTRDHKIPKSRGGTDDPKNIVLSCSRCNSGKNNRTPEEWRSGVKRTTNRKEGT